MYQYNSINMFMTKEAIIFGLVVSYLTFAANSTPLKPLITCKEPVRRLQEAHVICAQKNTSALASDKTQAKGQVTSAYVRCMATKMWLWTDAAGYNPKQVAKFFISHNQVNEVMVVIGYCNQLHKQTDLDSWAYEAYRCATAGDMGNWLKEYMKSVKS
ncbi:uncharacterized protein Obp99d [Eurosta solidaginis]|uniref:uncharacterized protein Obp99d n=1 Tax=Eurosta solidaginis TaxID=178769 RepID=UPI0035310AFF